MRESYPSQSGHAHAARSLGEPPAVPGSQRKHTSDRILVGLWLVCTSAILAGVGFRLAACLQYDTWTTLWESGPLTVAWDIIEGKPIYDDFVNGEGPVHLAHYGPAYYNTLALIGKLLDSDRRELIHVGRWVGIVGLTLALVSAAGVVRASGAPIWACALVCLGTAFLTSTGLRFIGSARPDSLAVGFSLAAVAFGVRRGRLSLMLSVAFLVLALFVKQNAVSAATALLIGWVYVKQWKRAASLTIPTGIIAIIVLLVAFDRTVASHLFLVRHAPVSWRYAWDLLATPTPAGELWMMLVVTGLMVLTSWRFMPSLEHGSNLHTIWIVCWVYWITAMIVALATGFCQGSDQNYFIEPAIALGPLIGLWAYRASLATAPLPRRITRGVAVLVLFNPLIMRLNEDLESPAKSAHFVNLLDGYGAEAPQWFAQLDQPVLSLDPWLAYISGEEVWVNDPVAYGWFAAALPEKDRLRRLAASGYFKRIVLPCPIEKADTPVHRDILPVWAGLAEEIRQSWKPVENYDKWWSYERNAE